MSIATVDALVAAVVCCLVVNEKRGVHCQKEYGNSYVGILETMTN